MEHQTDTETETETDPGPGPGPDPGLLEAGIMTGPPVQLVQTYQTQDDWTGKSDPKERRKLQNRVNQRLWRARQRRDRLKPDATIPSTQMEMENLSLNPAQMERMRSLPTMCNLSSEQREHLIARFNQRLYTSSASSSSSPRLDMLLTLVHFNVFRALVSNSLSMGFDEGWLTGDAISPYCGDSSSHSPRDCPPHLRPTSLQRTVEHHPWIDLFPFPAMRDNLLAADGDYDEDMLCVDLVEYCHVPSEQTGLIVWGEPGDPGGWEVSEPFLAKWAWILKGCLELLESTNHWRERRGEASMIWEL